MANDTTEHHHPDYSEDFLAEIGQAIKDGRLPNYYTQRRSFGDVLDFHEGETIRIRGSWDSRLRVEPEPAKPNRAARRAAKRNSR